MRKKLHFRILYIDIHYSSRYEVKTKKPMSIYIDIVQATDHGRKSKIRSIHSNIFLLNGEKPRLFNTTFYFNYSFLFFHLARKTELLPLPGKYQTFDRHFNDLLFFK